MYSELETYTEEPVLASRQSDCFVYTALVQYGALVKQDGGIVIEPGMFPFIKSRPPSSSATY